MVHKLGNQIQDLVTQNGSVLSGFSLRCGRCGRTCLVEAPRHSFTLPSDLLKKMFCPYCGAAGEPSLRGRITDTRPIWGG